MKISNKCVVVFLGLLYFCDVSVSIITGMRVRVWVMKCGLRALVASAVHCCIYLRGSGADPAHKHSSHSQWALSRPPETRTRQSYFATHLDALTATLCILHATENTLSRTLQLHWKLWKHFNSQNGIHRKCTAHSLKWNIRVNRAPHRHEKMTFRKDAKSGNMYWFHFFLTGMDSGLAPPQMEVSK